MIEETVQSCCLPAAQPRDIPATAIPLSPAPALPAESDRGMIHLAGGSFLMGSEGPEIWRADAEGPVREIEVAPFHMDECAVTNARFSAFIEATGYQTEAERFGWSYVFYKHLSGANKEKARGFSGEANWWVGVEGATWRRPEGPGTDIKKRLDHPVVHVSWNDARAFCEWAGKELPTEAQWEYAARGGLVQNLYPWGNDLTPKGKNGKPQHRCNIWQGKFPTLDTGQDGFTNTAPVKTFLPNAFGLYQMSGNTWEWCADPFATTPDRQTQNLSRRVVKGGSFLCHISYCNRYRCSARTGNTPDSTTSHTGFRCIRP